MLNKELLVLPEAQKITLITYSSKYMVAYRAAVQSPAANSSKTMPKPSWPTLRYAYKPFERRLDREKVN